MRYTTVVAFVVGLLLGRFIWTDSVKGQSPTQVPVQGVNIDSHNIHLGMPEAELRKIFVPPLYLTNANPDKLLMWKKPPFADTPAVLLGSARLQNGALAYITKEWGSDAGKDTGIFWNAIAGAASSSFGTTHTKATVYFTTDRSPESQKETITIELPGRSVDISRFQHFKDNAFISYDVSEDFAAFIGRE